MRIHFSNLRRPKALAKSIQGVMPMPLEPMVMTKLSSCQELVARLYGYDSWHELCLCVGTQAPSLDDSEIGEEEVFARRLYQIDRIVSAGLNRSTALYLVAAFHPTSATFAVERTTKAFADCMAALAGSVKATGFSLCFSNDRSDHGLLSYSTPDPFRRTAATDPNRFPALAEVALELFASADIGSPRAAYADTSKETHIAKWRTQWSPTGNGGILVGKALYGDQYLSGFSSLVCDPESGVSPWKADGVTHYIVEGMLIPVR